MTLAKVAKSPYDGVVSTMNISLPDELKAFVDGQVASGTYSSTSEYVRKLLRREQDRARLRELLLAGASSSMVDTADAAFFAGLRRRTQA